MKLNITNDAHDDMVNISQYISSKLHNPDAAIKTVHIIRSSWKHLLDFPLMGKDFPHREGLGYIVCKQYLIFYMVDGEIISIYRVLSSHQDYVSLILGES